MDRINFAAWSLKPIKIPASNDDFSELGKKLDEDVERVLTIGKLRPELLAYLAIARATILQSKTRADLRKDLVLHAISSAKTAEVQDLVSTIFHAAWASVEP